MGRAWPAPGEPLFLPEDTEGALELQDEEDATCSGCGNSVTESMDPVNAEAYRVRRPVCFACRAREDAIDASKDSNGNTNGMRYVAQLEDDDPSDD